ncbi:MAG: lipoyl(octanoyl) transferase LipB [Bacteroidota bacterium]|nr:lipoyl(octanoyl) transferase LipB [Bacteroidota bacterium]
MMKGKFEDWGTIDFDKAWEKQKHLFKLGIQQRKTQNDLGFHDTLILCEHPHVYTLGRNANINNLLLHEDEMKAKHINYIRIDRGGDITYHGPSQIVGYPIINLKNFGLYTKEYIHNIEEVIIRCLNEYNIKGIRLSNAPGVWLDGKHHGKTLKIASVGVRTSRFITMHGFALNVNPDMSYYQHINPCGFKHEVMTSMETVTGKQINVTGVKSSLKQHFSGVFHLNFQ